MVGPKSLTPYVNKGGFEQAAHQLIEAKRSKHTRMAYRSDLDRWVRFIYAQQFDLTRPTLIAATAFRDHLNATLSAVSGRRVLAALSALHRELHRQKVVSSNPFHPNVLPWPVAPRSGKTPAVAQKVATAMIQAAENDSNIVRGARDAAVLQLLWETGLRRSSVITILRAELQPEGNGLMANNVYVKGDKRESVFLPSASTYALTRWLVAAPDSPYVFPGKYGGQMHAMTINKIVTARASEVGVKDVSPHCFRAAFITDATSAGVPRHEVKAAVHHEDERTTAMYDRELRGFGVATQVASWREKKPE